MNGNAAVPPVEAKAIRELRIQGEGRFRPAGAVLLNYKLPWKLKKFNNGSDWGAALSAGPVYRSSQSGGNTTATNFGVFAGASFHLWERFWLTPGFHLGEFSDIPQGLLRANGSRIPDGFPSSFTGVSRWTTRFAIGITFKATDFKAATELLAKVAPASTGSGSAPGARGAAETAKPPAPTNPETAEALAAGSIAASIVELKKSIAAKEEAHAAASKVQSAAQASFDAAVQSVAVAQKEQKVLAAAAAEKEKASKAASDAVKPATDALLAANAANRPAAQTALTDAQAAAAKAAEELGGAKAQESAAAEAVKTKQAEAASAGERLSTATAVTSKIVQDLNKLKAELKKVCAALGASCPA